MLEVFLPRRALITHRSAQVYFLPRHRDHRKYFNLRWPSCANEIVFANNFFCDGCIVSDMGYISPAGSYEFSMTVIVRSVYLSGHFCWGGDLFEFKKNILNHNSTHRNLFLKIRK